MEDRVNKATLPALAKDLSELFPELAGRVIAVSDVMVDPNNLPTLPVCMLALRKAVPAKVTSPRRPTIEEHFVVEFWYAPQRYTRNGADTPYWAFYDYDTLQERVLTLTNDWISPRGSMLVFKGFTVDVNEYAVAICFQFVHTFYHCDYSPSQECVPPAPATDGIPFVVKATVTPHSDPCCDDCEKVDCEPTCETAMDEHHATRRAEGFP